MIDDVLFSLWTHRYNNTLRNLGAQFFYLNPAFKTYNGFDFKLLFLFVPLCKELHGNQVGNLFW